MATTTNFGWETPDDTDLVKDGAAAIRTALNGVDTSFVDLKGGTTGQVLSKASGTDLDFTWVAQDDSNAIQNAIIDAKGDLIVGASADTPARLAAGSNGYVLTADSAATNGIKWAAPAGGGKVLQVVQGTLTTQATTTSTSFIDTGLSASITPTATTSKILVMVTHSTRVYAGTGTDTGSLYLDLVRGSTSLAFPGDLFVNYFNVTGRSGINEMYQTVAFNYLDSPSTTSSTTYKTQYKAYAQTVDANVSGMKSSIILMEIGA